jgi:hypothetical protein
VLYLWAKGLNAKYIHKEIFPVYGGKCFSLNEVHYWDEKVSQGSSKVVDVVRPIAKVAEKTLKNCRCCSLRYTGKEMGQVYQC